jgi:hypothetical protein
VDDILLFFWLTFQVETQRREHSNAGKGGGGNTEKRGQTIEGNNNKNDGRLECAMTRVVAAATCHWWVAVASHWGESIPKDEPKKTNEGKEETRVNEWTRRTEPFSELSSQVASKWLPVSIEKRTPALVAAAQVQVMEQTPPVSTLWIVSEVSQWL